MRAQTILLNGSFAPSVINFRGPLIRDLVAAGHRVAVTVPDVSPGIRQQVEALGASIHEVPLQRTGTSFFADLAYRSALRRIIRNIHPDIAIGYTIKPNIWGSLAAASEGVRSASMITGLGYTFIQRATLRQRLIGGVSRWLYRRATAKNQIVVFQNPDDRDDFIAAGCLADPAKARMVNGSGVDTDHFRPVTLPDQPVFLMAARLLVSKGVREYAAAAIAVKRKHPECRFLLAGDRDASPDSIAQAELDHWTAQGIEHLGWIDDMRGPISQASVYVLPSYREGTPRTVLEASAMGRASITTDAPGCRETVRDGITGRIVALRDAGALASAMEEMAASPDLRRTMGAAAREFCTEKYAVEKVNRTLMDHLGL